MTLDGEIPYMPHNLDRVAEIIDDAVGRNWSVVAIMAEKDHLLLTLRPLHWEDDSLEELEDTFGQGAADSWMVETQSRVEGEQELYLELVELRKLVSTQEVYTASLTELQVVVPTSYLMSLDAARRLALVMYAKAGMLYDK